MANLNDKVSKLRQLLMSTPIAGKYALEHVFDGVKTIKAGFCCYFKAASAFSSVDDRFFQFPNYSSTIRLTEEDILKIKDHYGPYNTQDQLNDKIKRKKLVKWGDWASLICRTEVTYRRSLMAAVLVRHIQLIDDHTFSWRPLMARSWFFPPKGLKKLNTDASVVKSESESLVHLSMIITDKNGELIDWRAIKYHNSYGLSLEAMDGEILAMYHGIGLLDSHNIDEAILETDSKEVENVCRGKFSNSPRDEYLFLSGALKDRFEKSRHHIKHISREENVIADKICDKIKANDVGDDEITSEVLDILEEHKSNGVNIIFPPKSPPKKKKSR